MEDGKLGKYEISGILGKGAMGTVYDARDPIIDRRVAIKTLTHCLRCCNNISPRARHCRCASNMKTSVFKNNVVN